MNTVAGKATLPANARRIPIPAAALSQWLADIDDIIELKVTLRALALLASEPRRRTVPPSIALEDLLDDPVLAEAQLSGVENHARSGLAAAVGRGTLAAIRDAGAMRVLLNDADCRRYLQTAGVTELTAADLAGPLEGNETEPLPQPPTTGEPRANIFALYEELIGSYGHSMAEQLKATEEEYPAAWIEHAFALASQNNARSWNFVNSVLQRLVREGLPERMVVPNEYGESGNDPEASRRAEFLESYRRRHGRLPWESDSGTEPNRSQ